MLEEGAKNRNYLIFTVKNIANPKNVTLKEKSKGAQEAHEAIRPTDFQQNSGY